MTSRFLQEIHEQMFPLHMTQAESLYMWIKQKVGCLLLNKQASSLTLKTMTWIFSPLRSLDYSQAFIWLM